MKYTLFVTCANHASVLKDTFNEYECSERKDGDLTILTFNNISEDDAVFLDLYKASMTCSKNGIKVTGLKLP